MVDNHLHVGQFEELYYDPCETLQIVKDKGITEAVYSSTTSAKKDVEHDEVYSEIATAVSVYPPASFKPYFWLVPSYLIKNGLGKKIMIGSDFPITHYWATHYQNKKNITLEEQYQEDIEMMKKFEVLLTVYP